jgi:hypothetical protein
MAQAVFADLVESASYCQIVYAGSSFLLPNGISRRRGLIFGKDRCISLHDRSSEVLESDEPKFEDRFWLGRLQRSVMPSSFVGSTYSKEFIKLVFQIWGCH